MRIHDRYESHLRLTARWLLRSIDHGEGGSAAYYAPLYGWARPYPETTGYLIPTLLRLEQRLPDLPLRRAALAIGEWLIGIQHENGAWSGGLHPPRDGGAPSVFNTGQILKGLVHLHGATGEEHWLTAGQQAAAWLANGVGAERLWPGGDYRSSVTPSYYTEVVWPMLEVWSRTGDEGVKGSAVRALDAIVARKLGNGVIRGWGFNDSGPAFTHTIAYTIRGIIESALVLGEWARYRDAVVPALEVLRRKSELRGGRLPGAFDDRWNGSDDYVCLTGSAQTALCLLRLDEKEPDLRLVSAAAKLVDHVCSTQWPRAPIAGLRGAVAGSKPLWGPYMRFRYPNWAAKYHADALMSLMDRLDVEARKEADEAVAYSRV